MTGLEERLLNAGVFLTMIVAGIAYGRLLWAINIRPNASLWIMATAPGVIFVLMIWATRAVQGVASALYLYMLLDWLIFANAAFLAVLAARRLRKR